MRVELVAVGTELLLGQVVDTNSAWLGTQLAARGFDVLHTSCVGDNVSRIASELRMALARADAVIVCGGLGPTQDDLTRDAIALVAEVELVPDPAVEDRIRQMFASRQREMPANNLRQALVPVGASVLKDQPGTAPGLRIEVDDRVLYAVPGVPSELKTMVTGSVLPDLRARAEARGEAAVIASRVLRVWGLAESKIAELLADRIAVLDETPGATIAFLASGIEGIKVRITVRADDTEHAERLLAQEEAEIRPLLEPWIFAVDDASMESTVLDLLRSRGWSLATAESLTAGYVSARLATVPGASEVLRGGVVSYHSDIKHSLLGVPDGPVISEAAAVAMARGAARSLGADCAVATTGVAGPDLQEGQAVGTVCLAAVTPTGERVTTVHLPGQRETIRQLSVISVLDLLRRLVLDPTPGVLDGR